MPMATTRGIRIEVNSEYVEAESAPENNYYFFSYRISIENHGPDTVQLMNRHWIITDANGRREEVRGAGVVGQQPVIRPGQSYSYSSFCPLSTPVGTMQGSYQMICEDGGEFDAAIPPFSLAVPGILH